MIAISLSNNINPECQKPSQNYQDIKILDKPICLGYFIANVYLNS